jgi:hypothetical protein
LNRALRWLSTITAAEAATFLLTVVIAASTTCYTIYAKRQWSTMRDSNKINRSTMKISQRAFVFIPYTEFGPTTERGTGRKGWLLSPMMENGGNTPALKVRNVVNQNAPEYAVLPEGFNFPDGPATYGTFPNTNVKGGDSIVGPHGRLGMSALGVADEVLQQVNTGKSHVYLWGWVAYDDIFGCRHKTEYCEEIAGLSTEGQVMFSSCAEHNCADKDCKDYQPTDSAICKE